MAVKEKMSVGVKKSPRIDDATYEMKMLNRRSDYAGREIPDPTPMAPPVGFVKQDPLAVRIRQMIQSEMLAQAARQEGFGTFDEEDDFDVPDDLEPASGYENDEQFEPPVEAPAPASEPASSQEPGPAPEGRQAPQERPQGDPAPAEPSSA